MLAPAARVCPDKALFLRISSFDDYRKTTRDTGGGVILCNLRYVWYVYASLVLTLTTAMYACRTTVLYRFPCHALLYYRSPPLRPGRRRRRRTADQQARVENEGGQAHVEIEPRRYRNRLLLTFCILSIGFEFVHDRPSVFGRSLRYKKLF